MYHDVTLLVVLEEQKSMSDKWTNAGPNNYTILSYA